MELWQMNGLFTAIMGTGYLMASSNPIRHWRIILLGFTSKSFIILWFLFNYISHSDGSVAFKMILVNDFIWLFPFGMILYNAYRQQYVLDNELIQMNHVSAEELMDMFVTNKNNSIKDLSDEQPVMLFFLRHFGCTFCKEALLNIKELRAQIENKGTRIVLVNMDNDKRCSEILSASGLDDIEYICDSESILYKAFRLRRGTFTQLFGWKASVRALYLWFTKGLFVSSPGNADVYQMPGIFVIYKGNVVKQFIYESVADNPPYLELASIPS
jgi:peroxiredoxin